MLVGMAIVYGMTMGGMTSMLTNIDARRSSFVHRYTAFKEEVVSFNTVFSLIMEGFNVIYSFIRHVTFNIL